MRLQEETRQEIKKIPLGTVAAQSMALGRIHNEPLLVAMDGMLRFVKAYAAHYELKLVDDNVLGREYAKVISGLRGLLNGDGAVAMEQNITTDSKDNGVIEALYWECCKVGGFDGDNL